jgi:hypothetical protein
MGYRGDGIMGRSARLAESKFSGVLAQHQDGEEPLLVDDCHVEIFNSVSGQMKHHFDLVAVLTPARLLVLRGRGFTGPKKPWTLPLRDVDNVGVTREGNLDVQFEEHRMPGLWKLVFHDEALADLWMMRMHGACTALVDGDQRRRAESLASSQAELAAQRGEGRPEPTAAAPAPEPEERARFTRLHDLLGDLRAFATPAYFGRPFGEGHGLEEATRMVTSRLQDIDDVRECDGLMIVDLLTSAREENTDDLALQIMGATDQAVTEYPGAEASRSLGGAAVVLLREFQSGGSIWDLWQSRDDVAMEMLCWHSIARLRLANAERMPPVERPEWA